MRQAFAAAAAAAASEENRGLAAGLAAQGRGYQNQAQGLNAQANGLRGQLKGALSELRSMQNQLKDLNAQINQLKAAKAEAGRRAAIARAERVAANRIRHIKVRGFAEARGVDSAMVRQILSELPDKLLAEIGSVTYINEFGHGGAAGRTVAKPNIPEKGQIYLYEVFEYELAARQEQYRETLTHEAGHVLFERLASGVQRFEWGNFFNRTLRDGEEYVSPYAATSLREDFAESFMVYRLDPSELYKEFRSRYDFIDRLYKEISE